MFNHYGIPRDNLLNKTGDVTPEGTYTSPFRDPGKRFGSSLGALSTGRVSIIGFCVAYLSKAITIAVRYAGVRRQFGPPKQGESIVIIYTARNFPILLGLEVEVVVRNLKVTRKIWV